MNDVVSVLLKHRRQTAWSRWGIVPLISNIGWTCASNAIVCCTILLLRAEQEVLRLVKALKSMEGSQSSEAISLVDSGS